MASYYRARYYDPSVGRFTNEDPIGFNAGADFYAYTLNSPTNLTDPTGKNIICPKFLPWCRQERPPTCDKNISKPCKLSVSCSPTPNTRGYAHCTVTVQNGSNYTSYDGEPTGFYLWSNLIVIPGKGGPPGKNTFFTAPVPCDCAQKEADAMNAYPQTYIAPLTNSNTAASMITAACGVSPNWPSSAWGASNDVSP